MTVDRPARLEDGDVSSTLSFHSYDSFEPCLVPVDAAKFRRRPECVPPLDLTLIPDYESSSEEDTENEVSDEDQLEAEGGADFGSKIDPENCAKPPADTDG